MYTELEGHVLLKWEKVDFRAHGDALWVSMEDLQWQEIMEKWVTSYQTQGKLESIFLLLYQHPSLHICYTDWGIKNKKINTYYTYVNTLTLQKEQAVPFMLKFGF